MLIKKNFLIVQKPLTCDRNISPKINYAQNDIYIHREIRESNVCAIIQIQKKKK